MREYLIAKSNLRGAEDRLYYYWINVSKPNADTLYRLLYDIEEAEAIVLTHY